MESKLPNVKVEKLRVKDLKEWDKNPKEIDDEKYESLKKFIKKYGLIIPLTVARITLASIIAEVFSELIDTEIFSYVHKKMNDVLGVLFSNGVALIVDSFIFGFIAFSGVLPLAIVWEIIYVNILMKGAMSVLSAPLIKFIPQTVSEDMM